MGQELDTNDDILGLEERRESFNIVDLKREYRGPELKQKSEHIFAYADGEIEMSKEFLRKLVKFFDDPANRKKLEDGYAH
jgi:hypothetical protein